MMSYIDGTSLLGLITAPDGAGWWIGEGGSAVWVGFFQGKHSDYQTDEVFKLGNAGSGWGEREKLKAAQNVSGLIQIIFTLVPYFTSSSLRKVRAFSRWLKII